MYRVSLLLVDPWLLGFHCHLIVEVAPMEVSSTCWTARYNGYFSVLTFLDLFIAYYNIHHWLKFVPVLDSSLPLWCCCILLINFILPSTILTLACQSLLFSRPSPFSPSLYFTSPWSFFSTQQLQNTKYMCNAHQNRQKDRTNYDYIELYGWMSKPVLSRRSQSCQRLHAMRFHLHEVHEQVELRYDVRNQNKGCLWGLGTDENGSLGTLWHWWTCYIFWGVGYMGLYI